MPLHDGDTYFYAAEESFNRGIQMKRLLLLVLTMTLFASGASGSIQLKATDIFIATHDVPDTAGTAYTPADSVQVTVIFQDGTESMPATWFFNDDDQAVLTDNNLIFFDAWDDMNGTDGVGTYTVLMRWYDGSSAALDFQETYIVQQTTVGVEAAFNASVTALDSLADVLDTLENMEAWVATEVTAAKALDSLADVLDSLENMEAWIATEVTAAKALDSLADVLDSLETISTWLQDSLYAVIDSLQNYPARVDLIWNEPLTGATHNIATSSGKRLRALVEPITSVRHRHRTVMLSGTLTLFLRRLSLRPITSLMGQ